MHGINCAYLGKTGIHECEFPLRLASGTVQTTLSQLNQLLKAMEGEINGMTI